MIDPPDTCWDVCNMPLPIRNKYLINTYLLNYIPGKDWIVCVGAYCIRPTNTHDHGQMIDQPDTCWDICNTPLPIRVKNLIPIYRKNLKPGTCWGVCNMPLHIRIKNLILIYRMNQKSDTCWDVCNTILPIPDKSLINTYLLNPILGKDWIVCVGAYCIRPTNAHDYVQMIDSPGTCGGVCNMNRPIPYKYLINTYLLNPILCKD